MRAAKAFLGVFVATACLSSAISFLMYAMAMAIVSVGDEFGVFGVAVFMVLFGSFVGGLAAAAKEFCK